MTREETLMFEMFGTMRMLMNRVGPHRTKVGAKLNMSPIHHQTLFYIIHHENCKMADIAQGFHLSPAAITRTVNNLIEMGLVERTFDEKDRRIIRVKMSKKGLKTMKEGRKEMALKMAHVVKRMDAKDFDALIRGLGAFNKALRETEETN